MSVQIPGATDSKRGLSMGQASRVVLTNDDILALADTVPILVPAFPGRIIVPAFISVAFDPWVADYTGTISECAIDYPTTTPDIYGDFDLVSSSLAPGAAQVLFEQIWDSTGGDLTLTPTDDFVGQPLGLIVTASVAIAGGDPGNQWVISTLYYLLP